MDEQRQIELTQKYLERKRRQLARRESIGELTEADMPWPERTPSEWERYKELRRREVRRRYG